MLDTTGVCAIMLDEPWVTPAGSSQAMYFFGLCDVVCCGVAWGVRGDVVVLSCIALLSDVNLKIVLILCNPIYRRSNQC